MKENHVLCNPTAHELAVSMFASCWKRSQRRLTQPHLCCVRAVFLLCVSGVDCLSGSLWYWILRCCGVTYCFLIRQVDLWRYIGLEDGRGSPGTKWLGRLLVGLLSHSTLCRVAVPNITPTVRRYALSLWVYEMLLGSDDPVLPGYFCLLGAEERCVFRWEIDPRDACYVAFLPPRPVPSESRWLWWRLKGAKDVITELFASSGLPEDWKCSWSRTWTKYAVLGAPPTAQFL